MATLKADIKKSSQWLIKAFESLNIELDYSVKSVEEIETLLSKEIVDGEPVENGFLSKGIGGKIFAMSSYVGEVIIRNTKATKWETDDKDPQGEVNIKLVSANGTHMFPAHRIMKRIQNGEEDNVYHYTALAVKKYMNYDGEIPKDFYPKEESKPWWRFW